MSNDFSSNTDRNKVKQEALEYSNQMQSTIKGGKFNKPIITANRIKMDIDYYNLNSPSNYKISLCDSKICRNYKNQKGVISMFSKGKRGGTAADHFYESIDSNLDNKLTFKSFYNSKLFKEETRKPTVMSKLSEFFEQDYNSGYKGKSSLARNVRTMNDLRNIMRK